MGPIPRVVPGLGWAPVLQTPGARTSWLDEPGRTRFLVEAGPDRLRWVLSDGSRQLGLELTPAAAAALGTGTAAVPCGPLARGVCVLHRHLLPAWGAATDAVRCAHSWATALVEAAASAGLAVEPSAAALTDVLAAGRAGAVLPHKATPITPKPRAGMVMLAATGLR